MADVRSMLAAERAARRVNHPQAQYTSSGSLLCKACRIHLKSDALWQSHVSSAQHISALKCLASGLKTQNATQGVKRKADSDEDEAEDTGRKLNKAARREIEPEAVREEAPTTAQETNPFPIPEAASEAAPAPQQAGAVNEDEWAAFQQAMADEASQAEQHARAPELASAVISAAPVSAAELAAKAREEASAQAKERRQAEIEDEKEDAQRRLEDEFDEMEELEARVKRLKDQREALRKRRPTNDAATSATVPILQKKGDVTDDEKDQESEDDDWDNWGAL